MSKLAVRAHVLRSRALVALERLEDASHAVEATLVIADAIDYAGGRLRALRLQAEIARRLGKPAAEAVAKAESLVARFAATLADDELRRALYAAAGLGHDARP
jgi:hypothetical protein